MEGSVTPAELHQVLSFVGSPDFPEPSPRPQGEYGISLNSFTLGSSLWSAVVVLSFSRHADPWAGICHQGLSLPERNPASVEPVSAVSPSPGFGCCCSSPGRGQRGAWDSDSLATVSVSKERQTATQRYTEMHREVHRNADRGGGTQAAPQHSYKEKYTRSWIHTHRYTWIQMHSNTCTWSLPGPRPQTPALGSQPPPLPLEGKFDNGPTPARVSDRQPPF